MKIQKNAYNYHAYIYIYIDLMLYHAHYSTGIRPRRGCIQALPISNPLTSILYAYNSFTVFDYFVLNVCMYIDMS